MPEYMPTCVFATYKSCSWCHASNRMDVGGRPVHCTGCGHRADVARVGCDCPICEPAKHEAEILRYEAEEIESCIRLLRNIFPPQPI